jgi:hypothetical protein
MPETPAQNLSSQGSRSAAEKVAHQPGYDSATASILQAASDGLPTYSNK